MPYTSPFQLLGLDTSSEINKSTLNLARRKLFAEIDLSPTQTIVRGETELTKDDVLRLFDGLDKNQNLEFHRLLANDYTLLYFLENSTVKMARQSRKHKYVIASFADEPMYGSPEFIAFISPFFAESLQKAVITCIDRQEPTLLQHFLETQPLLITNAAQTAMWSNIESLLFQKAEHLQDILTGAENGRYFDLKTLHEFSHANLLRCLNLLPASFWSVRESFAVKIHNLSVAYLNKGNTSYASYAIGQAMVLTCSPQMKQKLEELQVLVNNATQQEIYAAQRNENQRSSSSDDSGGCIIQIFLIFLLFIFRMACSGSSSSPKSYTPTYPYRVEYPNYSKPEPYPSYEPAITPSGKFGTKNKKKNESGLSPEMREIMRDILKKPSGSNEPMSDEAIDKLLDKLYPTNKSAKNKSSTDDESEPSRKIFDVKEKKATVEEKQWIIEYIKKEQRIAVPDSSGNN